MPTPPPFPRRFLVALAIMTAVAGCQPNSPRPVPSVPQIGANLKCAPGDHGYEDPQAGWSFCYPDTWKYIERSQASQSPPGLDLTFDVTYVPAKTVPCASPAAPAAGSPQPAASPCSGDFAFMIISTYERGSAGDLAQWVRANLKPVPELQRISWSDSLEAARLPDGRRIALTQHYVVIMDLHSGLLDLETEMSSRLNTWKFAY